MALENSEVLENLIKQKTELESQIETARVTYLKILGAIDALSQIEESKEGGEETEPEAEETVEGE
tara:strand:+ start:1128 stop:1322 length:195 start_codon:yes stop_codon:yes gene_type:complete